MSNFGHLLLDSLQLGKLMDCLESRQCFHASQPLAGALHSDRDVTLSGTLTIERCHSGTAGGGLYLSQGNLTTADAATFVNCTSKLGDAFYVDGSTYLPELVLAGSSASFWASGQIEIRHLSCWHAKSCHAEGHTSLQVAHPVCPRGTGFLPEELVEAGQGCLPCPASTFRVSGLAHHCSRCPTIPGATVGCTATKLSIPAGWTVQSSAGCSEYGEM